MKTAAAIAALLLALGLAAPASATQGFGCRPAKGKGPELGIVIGHGAGPALAGASLEEGKRLRSTFDRKPSLLIAQSWIDERHLWLDLTDANALRYEARLRAAFDRTKRGPATASGTLDVGGRSYKVRCTES